MSEEEYNKMVVKSNPPYSLLDRKLVSVSGGPKKLKLVIYLLPINNLFMLRIKADPLK